MPSKSEPTRDPSTQNLSTIKTGEDGNKWIVVNHNKKKKWEKLKGKVKKYATQDNGSNPFLVVISENKIIIFKATDLYENDKKLRKKMFNEEIKFEPWSECMKIDKFTKVFIGKNSKKYTCCPNYGSFTGNSILVELKPLKYIFIGHVITSFVTKEPIVKYESVMGNNDVPYPFALTENYIYLMLHMVYTERIDGNPEPYGSYYKHEKIYTSKWQSTKNNVLVKRWVW